MADRLRVAVDATPLIGRPTGVGAFCAGVLGGLAARPDAAPAAFAVSWRRRHAITGRVPEGVEILGRAMPARPLHAAWGSIDLPPLEWFVGRADVVHGTNYVVPPTRRAARVVTVHDLTTVRYPELCNRATLAFPALVRRAVAGGAWVHTHCASVAAEVTELLGVPATRVRPVASGVPPLPAPASGVPARFLPESAGRYVLAVGTAEPRKDLPGLVRAFDALAGSRPELALVLAGPAGWGAEELDHAVAGAAASRRIVRTGWVDDATLAGLMAGAAVLAYPSVYEGFGYPPLQAMAAGTPVVATRDGTLEEVLGEAAMLVPVRDADALAGALAEVLDSEAKAKDLAGRGRAHVAGYTWERCAAGLMDLYRDAMAG